VSTFLANGYIREWAFDLHRDEANLRALTRDELLSELLEIGEVSPTVVRAAAFHGEDAKELRRLLSYCLHIGGAASFKPATTSHAHKMPLRASHLGPPSHRRTVEGYHR
jgi:hypothetical protein